MGTSAFASFCHRKTPAHIVESNPFWSEIYPLHLTGYFVSVKGEVKLTELSPSTTKAEKTTWYKIHMTPILYWKLWSNAIVERFHQAYLKELELNSEK